MASERLVSDNNFLLFNKLTESSLQFIPNFERRRSPAQKSRSDNRVGKSVTSISMRDDTTSREEPRQRLGSIEEVTRPGPQSIYNDPVWRKFTRDDPYDVASDTSPRRLYGFMMPRLRGGEEQRPSTNFQPLGKMLQTSLHE